jgi:nicotinamide riboside transporter PnuC
VVGLVSKALYSTYFASPLGLITGLLGLASVLIHGSVGYELAVLFGLVPSRTVVSTFEQSLYIELLTAGVWAMAYGLVGWFVDWKRSQKSKASSHVDPDLPAA